MGFKNCSISSRVKVVTPPICPSAPGWWFRPKSDPSRQLGKVCAFSDLGYALESNGLAFPWLSMYGRRGMAGEDSELYWGTVDGFKLLRMEKDWLYGEYKQYFDEGDGEWFVTVCLCAGMELEYAVALRSAIIRHMGLAQLNGSEELNDAFNVKFPAIWWVQIRQFTIDITKGKAPLPDVQLGQWVRRLPIPSGLKRYYYYYRSGHYTYIPLAKLGKTKLFKYCSIDLVDNLAPNLSRYLQPEYQAVASWLLRYPWAYFRRSNALSGARAFTDLGYDLASKGLEFAWLTMSGRRSAGGEDSEIYWGTVDGFKLLRMEKDWLHDRYAYRYNLGDGEWFVTVCLCAGIKLEYAVALRSAIIRHMGLAQLNGSEELNDAFKKKFHAKWNWDLICQLMIEITEGKAPLPDVQLGQWVQKESLPSGLQKYYQNGHYTYIPVAQQLPDSLTLFGNSDESKSREQKKDNSNLVKEPRDQLSSVFDIKPDDEEHVVSESFSASQKEVEEQLRCKFNELSIKTHQLQQTLLQYQGQIDEQAAMLAIHGESSDLLLKRNKLIERIETLEANGNAIQKEMENELLQAFYDIFQLRLNALFHTYLTKSTGQYSSPADNKLIAQQAITGIGAAGLNLLPIPYMGIATGALSMSINGLLTRHSNRKLTREAKRLTGSRFVNTTQFESHAEALAYLATLTYELQIRQLTLKGAVTFAECGIKRLELYAKKTNQSLTDTPDAFLLALADTEVQIKDDKGLLYPEFLSGFVKLETEGEDKRWSEVGAFTQPGIESRDGERYISKNSDPHKYGYRRGTSEQATQLFHMQFKEKIPVSKNETTPALNEQPTTDKKQQKKALRATVAELKKDVDQLKDLKKDVSQLKNRQTLIESDVGGEDFVVEQGDQLQLQSKTQQQIGNSSGRFGVTFFQLQREQVLIEERLRTVEKQVAEQTENSEIPAISVKHVQFVDTDRPSLLLTDFEALWQEYRQQKSQRLFGGRTSYETLQLCAAIRTALNDEHRYKLLESYCCNPNNVDKHFYQFVTGRFATKVTYRNNL